MFSYRKGSKHLCHGEPVSKTEVPPCYDEEKGIWENVSLKEFMDCPSNWAANRQTRYNDILNPDAVDFKNPEVLLQQFGISLIMLFLKPDGECNRF